MAELDAAGFELLPPPWDGRKFRRTRSGPSAAPPPLVAEVERRIAECLLWLKGRECDADAAAVCPLCRAAVTRLGQREGMIMGLCGRPTTPYEFDGKAVLCPFRRK